MTRRRTYRRREAIFHQGDPADRVYVLETGYVAIFVQDEREEHRCILDIVRPGEFFGELALIGEAPWAMSAQALQVAQILALPAAPVREVIGKYPQALQFLTYLLCQRVNKLTQVLADQMFLDLDARTAKVLLELASSTIDDTSQSGVVDVPLTQMDWAALLGVARSSVNRVLSLYEEQGAIRRSARRMMILDPQLLRANAT